MKKVLLVITLTILTITFTGLSVVAQNIPFRVIAVKGEAFYGSSIKEANMPIKTGLQIPVGSMIKTAEGANLMLQQGTSFNIFQVRPKSSIRIDKSSLAAENDYNTTIYVAEGTALFNAAKVKDKGKFELDTPLAVGSVRGTQGYVATVKSAPFTPSAKVPGVTKGTTIIVYTSQGVVAWSPKNGVITYKEIIDENKGMKIPKSVVRAMFDFPTSPTTMVNKKQAFLFIPEDAEDHDLIWDEVDMEAFANLISSLAEAGFFSGPPPFGPFVPPGEEQDTLSSSPIAP